MDRDDVTQPRNVLTARRLRAYNRGEDDVTCYDTDSNLGEVPHTQSLASHTLSPLCPDPKKVHTGEVQLNALPEREQVRYEALMSFFT
mgnify:FL=1